MRKALCVLIVVAVFPALLVCAVTAMLRQAWDDAVFIYRNMSRIA